MEEFGAAEFGAVGVDLTVDFVEEAIEALPLLGADFFADLTSVFAGEDDAGSDRRGLFVVEAEGVDEFVDVAFPLAAFRLADGGEDSLPSAFGGRARFIEHEAHVDVEQAHGVFGALEVAAHPIETVGYA